MITSTGIVRSVTGAEVEHFEQYGFVRLKCILADEEIENLRRAAELVQETLDVSPSSCDLTIFADRMRIDPVISEIEYAKDPPFCGSPFGSFRPAKSQSNALYALRQKGHYIVDSSVWRRNTVMRDYALHSELPFMAAELLQLRSVRFYNDHFVIKQAGTRERTAFHQDISYLHVDGDRGCVFTLFLDRVRNGSGCPGYVPSSHRWGQVFKPNVLISSTPCPETEGVDLPGIENSPSSFGVQYIDAEPGDILAHHVLTLHGMESNRGKTPCRTFAFCYVDAALRHQRRPGLPIPPTYNQAARDYSEMDPFAHPVVWPPLKTEARTG